MASVAVERPRLYRRAGVIQGRRGTRSRPPVSRLAASRSVAFTGHREDDRVAAHGLDVLQRDDAGAREADEDVGALERVAGGAAEPLLVGVLGEPLLHRVHVVRAAPVERARPVARDDVLGARAHEQLRRRDAGRAGAGEHDPRVAQALLHDLERVEERREDHDRGAVLVVVEHGDLEVALEPRRVVSRILPRPSIFPPRRMRNVRSDTLTTFPPCAARIASTTCWPCGSSRALKVMSRVIVDLPTTTRSMAPISPPALPIAEVTRPSIPGLFTISSRTVRL